MPPKKKPRFDPSQATISSMFRFGSAVARPRRARESGEFTAEQIATVTNATFNTLEPAMPTFHEFMKKQLVLRGFRLYANGCLSVDTIRETLAASLCDPTDLIF